MALSLYAGWTLRGDALPERLLEDAPQAAPAFSLPGAQQLAAFADLLGTAPAAQQEEAPDSPGVPFTLPAMIPQDVPGEITLSREVDFSTLQASRAFFSFDLLVGSGRVTLTPCPPRFPRPGMPEGAAPSLVGAFDHSPLTMDVTQAMHTHRRYLLTLHFDAARPAGVCGAALLRTCTGALLERITLEPHPIAGTITLKADILPLKNGTFQLHAQLCPAKAPASAEDAPPIRAMALHLIAHQAQTVEMTIEARCPRFAPGEAYDAPGLKIQLFEKPAANRLHGSNVLCDSSLLCDSAVLLCGYPADAPASMLPLRAQDYRCAPEALLERLHAMHVFSVSLDAPASDPFYRLMTRSGVAVLSSTALPEAVRECLVRYPCVAFADAAPAEKADLRLSAWQLCGLTTYARPADPAMTPAELLREAAGCEIDVQAYGETLAWLRAVSIRLRAEAIRQGKRSGPYCAAGEWTQSDIAQAISTALAPVHLSALPLYGAWWTGSHFSAALAAFLPKETFARDQSIRAVAQLEDAEGHLLARAEFPCAAWRENTGMLEATLPQSPCVLELTTRLYADEEILEESVLPVYVGERGPLEAAF